MREAAGPHPIQLLMLTSAGMRGDAARCREAGMVAYLTRPVTQSDLLDAIMTVMASAASPSPPVLITRHLLRQARRRLRILLAEDHPVNQTVTRSILEDRGHYVSVASDGAEAEALYRRQVFDLILTDVQMPVVDGLEFTAAVRDAELETGTHIPIIAVTANTMRGERERCLRAGMDGYVTKPIYPKELFEAIDTVLGTDADGGALPRYREPVLLDRIRALEAAQGSLKRLKEKVLGVLDRIERDRGRLADAVATKDSDGVAEPAEALREDLDDVAARPAAQAASRLAVAARSGVLPMLYEHHGRLVESLHLVIPVLQALSREGSARLLVADDDEISRMVLEDTLRDWGYEVEVAADGHEAWQILQAEDAPRLAILDWMMPGMHGVQVCREVRRWRQEPYIYQILLTTRADKEDIIEGLDAGADDYLVKPFDAHELKVRLRAGLRVIELQEELIHAREGLRIQATHDALTGVYNRRAILDILETELGRVARGGAPLGVVLVDLDHFKRINDTHGHQAGDAVLREAALRLRGAIRTYDNVGRYGGEEFLLIMAGCDATSAMMQAERLRRTVAEAPVGSGGDLIAVSASLGVASTGQTSERRVDRLVRAADLALYRAKLAGRNRVEEAVDADFREEAMVEEPGGSE